MAIELKKLTLEGGLLKAAGKSPTNKRAGASSDSDDSSDEAPTADDATEKEALERAMRHVNDRDWTKFCSGPLKYFETKWTKKLEDYDKHNKSESGSSHEDEHESGSDEDKDNHNVFSKGGASKNTKGSGSRKDRYRMDNRDDEDEEDEEEQESIIESLLKSDKFNNKKREPIKIARPTREELDSARD